MRVVVCANLPYYITSPIVMLFLENKLPVKSITVMVQKEAADRLCAEVGSRDGGAVTVAVSYYAHSEELFALFGQADAVIPALNHAKADFLLKTVHHMGQTRLGDPQPLRRAGEAAHLHGGELL